MKKSDFILKNSYLLQIFLFLIITVFTISCNKDEPELTRGYFPKTISLGEGAISFEFEYNDQNQIIQEKLNSMGENATFKYEYNTAGLMSKIWWDEYLYAEFEYANGIIKTVTFYDEGINPEVNSVGYANGTYSFIETDFRFVTDERNQLLNHDELHIKFSYSDEPGIYKNLKIQPARYFGYLSPFINYNLMVSNDAIDTFENRGKIHEIRNKIDDNGNITQVEMIEIDTGTRRMKWDITYEERNMR